MTLASGIWTKASSPDMQATQGWEASAVQEVTDLAVTGGIRRWYSGGWTNQAIGTAFRATASDAWTKYASNPIIGQGNGGVAGACGRPTVIEVAGTFHMFFNLNAGTTMKRCTSSDGITFSAPDDVLSLPSGATIFGNCSIVINGGVWHMIVEALHSSIWKMWYATSGDGTAFTIQAGPLTTLSYGGAYGGPMLSLADGDWTLYYHAATSGNLPTAIYRATSADLTTWAKVGPVEINRSLAWEVDQSADPFWRIEDGQIAMYYSGVDNDAEISNISKATRSLPS